MTRDEFRILIRVSNLGAFNASSSYTTLTDDDGKGWSVSLMGNDEDGWYLHAMLAGDKFSQDDLQRMLINKAKKVWLTILEHVAVVKDETGGV